MNERLVQVSAEPDLLLEGSLHLPAQAQGIVLFAHGSGSSRHSPRNLMVAQALNNAGFATLLMDLLTEEEEHVDNETHHLRFDIALLAQRLAGAVDWLTRQADTRPLNIGLFGASTGSAAALSAAALRPSLVSAIVSRGGRPELAGSALPLVRAATLFIVGSGDAQVLAFNQEAMSRLQCPNRLEIVPGASHLFEEPGALEIVARLASDWFTDCLIDSE